jgi:hypothetical protein
VELAPAVVQLDLQLISAHRSVLATCAGLALASCVGISEPAAVTVVPVESAPKVEAHEAHRSGPRPSADDLPRGSWRPMTEEERDSSSLAPTDVFAVDGGESAVWVVHGGALDGGELRRRPLDGGPTEVVPTSLPVHRLHALHLGIAVVDLGSSYPGEQWLVPLDGSAPARVLRAGQNHARAGDELWASDEDASWKVEPASVPRFFYPATVRLQVDPMAIYLIDVPGNLVRIDRRTGVSRTLATGALHDLALDGDSILWTRPEEERPGFVSSRRMIMRTPRGGGVSTHLTTAERVCGLWAFREHVYFFSEDQRAEVRLFRTPRRGSAASKLGASSEPELVVTAPWVNTSFSCTEGATIVGTSLVWGSRYGTLVRADLSRSPVVLEVLDPDRPVVEP